MIDIGGVGCAVVFVVIAFLAWREHRDIKHNVGCAWGEDE